MPFCTQTSISILFTISCNLVVTAEELMPPPPSAETTVMLRNQAPPNRLDNVLQNPLTPRPAMLAEPVPGDALPRPVPQSPDRFIQPWKFDLTFIPAGDRHGLGIIDIEGSATFRVPFDSQLSPLLLTPGAAIRFWNGPDWLFYPKNYDGTVTLYDLYLDFGWRPRVAEWLYLDLGLTPGIYTDFNDVNGDSFLLRGRAIGIFALSESFQIVAGLLYVNRLSVDVIPALGIMWKPSEETKVDLVFPQPRISHRFHCDNGVQWWGYIAGDFGGGTWSIERIPGHTDMLDYRDWRLLFGLEAITAYELRGRIELGYVFNRTVELDHRWRTEFEPENAFLFRLGFSY